MTRYETLSDALKDAYEPWVCRCGHDEFDHDIDETQPTYNCPGDLSIECRISGCGCDEIPVDKK